MRPILTVAIALVVGTLAAASGARAQGISLPDLGLGDDPIDLLDDVEDLLDDVGDIIDIDPEDPNDEGGLELPLLENVANGVLEHNEALAAIQNGLAVPADELVGVVSQLVEGRTIDVVLVAFDGELYYRVKLVDPAGLVFSVYFHADTADPVASQELLNAIVAGGG